MRLNNAQDGANTALHCAIAACHGDEDSRKENYRLMIKNSNVFRKNVGLPTDVDSEKSDLEKLVATWRSMQQQEKNQD